MEVLLAKSERLKQEVENAEDSDLQPFFTQRLGPGPGASWSPTQDPSEVSTRGLRQLRHPLRNFKLHVKKPHNGKDERAKNENALDTATLLRRQQNQDIVTFLFLGCGAGPTSKSGPGFGSPVVRVSTLGLNGCLYPADAQ